jgi:hypothetical protein
MPAALETLCWLAGFAGVSYATFAVVSFNEVAAVRPLSFIACRAFPFHGCSRATDAPRHTHTHSPMEHVWPSPTLRPRFKAYPDVAANPKSCDSTQHSGFWGKQLWNYTHSRPY